MNVENKPHQTWLLIGLTINLVATILHYTDNFIFFTNYPAPAGMHPQHIWIAWLILVPFAVIGYIQYAKGNFWVAYSCLCVWALTSVGGIAHYFFGSMSDFSLKMHIFIWFEEVTGLALLGFVFWSCLILREWRKERLLN
ncbi:MAG: hypothetical protein HC789_15170 [Microcoleus sp. CSU_2_2]|nr:hypothetical protein [Microcoleus sp. SU_5_3]NJS11611.1 hypothetical protein [Microcoleus sp. CSU_2_2]